MCIKRSDFFLRDFETDFINARRCINGTDRAHEIADLAENYKERNNID